MPHIDETRNGLVEFPACVGLTIARPEDVEVPVGVTVVDSMPVSGVIDTGADLCGIYIGHAEEMGLQPIDRRPLSNSSGSRLTNIYLVDLIFDDGQRRTYEAAECSFGSQKLDFLLGRDFLCCARFVFDGPAGHYSLDFD